MRLRAGPSGPARCLAGLTAAVVLGGCGGGGGPSVPPRPTGVTFAAARAIKPGVPKSVLLKRLGEGPVLTADPTDPKSSGCDYFAMEGKPLSDVWEFCFDKQDKVNLGATLYSPDAPAPPSGASPARAALIARGDSACQSETADLAKPTKLVSKQLRQLKASPTEAKRRQAAATIASFNRFLRKTLVQLKAFNAPADEESVLGDYLGKLEAQTKVLSQARAALLASNTHRYNQLGDRFSALARSAKTSASDYGFTVCSAATFG